MELLTWSEIEQRYSNEWVELIDFDWPKTEPHPTAGVVRVHAKDRTEFDRMLVVDPPAHSAIVLVGRDCIYQVDEEPLRQAS